MPFVNSRLRKQLDNWEHDAAFDDIRALNQNRLEKYLESEWTRAKELDDKLFKLTSALSIAVTVGGVLAKVIVEGLVPAPGRTVTLILLFGSMAMFLFGALIGFRGLRPKPRFGYGAGFMNVVDKGSESARHEYRCALAGFQTMNLVRSNEATAAIDLIRNGVILFVLAIAVSFFVPRLPDDKSAERSTTVAPAHVLKEPETQLHDPRIVTPKVATPQILMTTESASSKSNAIATKEDTATPSNESHTPAKQQ